MGNVIVREVPQQSEIAQRLAGATFYDCYAVATNDNLPVLTHYLAMVGKTPAWVKSLMTLRNRTVALLGLKNLGHLGDVDVNKPVEAYVVGDRIGIFDIRYLTDNEVILGDTDKHLTVQLSLCKTGSDAHSHMALTTVVHNRNLLGRVYMLFVAPVHKKIVPAMLRRLKMA